MPTSAVRLLRAIAGDEGQADAELLGRFADRRDEVAFGELVRRHAPMVWGVCRRILPTDQDAEDAFQATFLVLVEKARTAPRGAVGNWLYGVARRAALLARRTIVTRRERACEMDEHPAPEPLDELRAALDEELSRLPYVYRTVIILCDLEGRTRREAAATLGWPEGTVAGRLVRAREMLAKRLARHAPVVSVAAVLSGTASARMPEVLPATAPIPAGVAALAREVLGVMARGNLVKMAVAALLLGCAGLGMVFGQKPAAKDPPALPGATEAPMNPRKADDVAWGQEDDGLQIGLTGVAPTYRHGEKARMEVKLRNVGKAEVRITHGLLRGSPPQVTADGVRMTVAMPLILGIKVRLEEWVIKPGETITLYNPEAAVESEDMLRLQGLIRVDTPTTYLAPGKYRIGYGGMIQSHPQLSTGMVEFGVKDPVVWGQEVNGIQAGLVGPGPVRIDEKALLVVVLRNVSKEAITLSAWPLWFNPPRVVDAAGKQVRATRPPEPSFEIIPTKLTLKPGETTLLAKTNIFVVAAETPDQPFPDGVVDQFTIHVRPGKYRASFTGFVQDRPTLSTGTVEFAAQAPAGAFTAWGEEIGGLQAGLSLKGERRAYHHGETVTLVVRVRNVGKEAVKFQYIRQFLDESPPAVTGADGKPIPQDKVDVTGVAHVPVEVSLDPGKEVVLETRIHGASGRPFELRPARVGTPAARGHPLYVGTGKVSLQYEKVFGDSSIGRAKIDPSLSELATGKLEIEVAAPEVRLPEPEPDVQEVSDPQRVVRGPPQKDGSRKIKSRKEVVGQAVRVEGIAWGQPFGLKGQEGTISPHAGPHVVYEGGSVFVRGVDFTETKARGKPVRVTGTLRFEPKTATRWGDVKGYYYVEATGSEVLDAVTDPYLVYLEK